MISSGRLESRQGRSSLRTPGLFFRYQSTPVIEALALIEDGRLHRPNPPGATTDPTRHMSAGSQLPDLRAPRGPRFTNRPGTSSRTSGSRSWIAPASLHLG